MMPEGELREGEVPVEMPEANDAGLVFIGRIRTPWTSRQETPRQGSRDDPVCRLEIFEPWLPALKGVELYQHLESALLVASLAAQSGAAKPEEKWLDTRYFFAAFAGA